MTVKFLKENRARVVKCTSFHASSDRMPSSTPPVKAPATGPAAATSSFTGTAAFSSFLLSRIASNPFLILEAPRSLTPATTPTAIPSTFDSAQRAFLLHPPSSPASQSAHASPAAGTTAPATSAAAVTALLQRALVDAPLLPVGGAHLLHELVWGNFVACAEAAKQVGCYQRALHLHDARAREETKETEKAAGLSKGERDATPLGSSPLSDSPFLSMLGDGGDGVSASSGASATGSLVNAEELSVSLAPELLRARLAQAQARLGEQRAVLQRGLRKLRRIAQDLHDYDAIPIAELRRQRQATVRELLAPVAVTTGSELPRGDESAVSVAVSEQDRKRQRTAE